LKERDMALRIILAVVGVLLALNGFNMLFDPVGWYQSIPSVVHTGPLNQHFVRDIGIAYLAATLGLGLAAWRLSYFWPGVLTALAFVGLHGLLHIWETLLGFPASQHAGVIDIVGVYGPPIVLLLIILWVSFQPQVKEA
jgi:hypothetical protein